MENVIQLPGMEYLKCVIKELELELWKSEEDPSTSWRITYMYNDSVESYLQLDDVVIKGKYEKEKACTSLQLVKEEERYGLVGQQEKRFFSIWFSKVTFFAKLYRYADIGHFWVKGEEPYRQLVYELEIIQDKKRYLGEWACNEKELKLLALLDFSPIRSFYCVPWEEGYCFSTKKNGMDAYEEVLDDMEKSRKKNKKIGDCYFSSACIEKQWELQKALLDQLKQAPTKEKEKEIYKTLIGKKGNLVYQWLQKEILEASSVYGERRFGEKEDFFVEEQRKKWIQKWTRQGWVGTYPDFSRRKGIFYEQMHVMEELPFTTEAMHYTFHCLISKCSFYKKRSLKRYFGIKKEMLPLNFGFFSGCGTGKIYSHKCSLRMEK